MVSLGILKEEYKEHPAEVLAMFEIRLPQSHWL